jgi:hypothetical protein
MKLYRIRIDGGEYEELIYCAVSLAWRFRAPKRIESPHRPSTIRRIVARETAERATLRNRINSFFPLLLLRMADKSTP